MVVTQPIQNNRATHLSRERYSVTRVVRQQRFALKYT